MKYLLLLTLFFSQLSFSQNKWHEIIKSDDGVYTYYAKFEKAERDDIHIWLKTTEVDKVVKLKNGKTINKKQNYIVVYMVFHCGSRTLDKLDYVFYDGGGKVLDQGNDYIYNERVIPDSAGEIIYNFVCSIDEKH